MLFFFFSSRRRHTRCALVTGVQTCALPICVVWRDTGVSADGRIRNAFDPPGTWRRLRLQAVTGSAARAAVGHADDAGVPRSAGWHRNRRRCRRLSHQDRKSVVKGKSVSVRVDLGGRRTIKKKKKKLK